MAIKEIILESKHDIRITNTKKTKKSTISINDNVFIDNRSDAYNLIDELKEAISLCEYWE